MKRLAIALLGAFAIVLAIVVGKGMSADAMAVVVGVVCGIGASIPTSLLMLFLLSRRQEAEPPAPAMPAPQIPSIMIISPPNGMLSPYIQDQAAYRYAPPAYGHGPRQFQLLGSDDDDPLR
jgi:hypothetical protein